MIFTTVFLCLLGKFLCIIFFTKRQKKRCGKQEPHKYILVYSKSLWFGAMFLPHKILRENAGASMAHLWRNVAERSTNIGDDMREVLGMLLGHAKIGQLWTELLVEISVH